MHPAVFMSHHEAGAFEHAQVFRDRGQGHIIRGGQVAHGSFALRQARQNAAAGGIGERGESGVEGGF